MVHFWTLLLVLLLPFVLANCVVGPDFKTPDGPDVSSYTETTSFDDFQSGKKTLQQFMWGKELSAQWWTLFQSKDLNTLIEKGLQNSPNLQAAHEALAVAQENLNAQVGALIYPSVNLELQAQRQKYSGASTGSPGTPPTTFNLYSPSVNISYTFDMFGGNQRQLEALHAQVHYQHFLWEAAYLTLTSNIALAVIREAVLQEQIQITKELIALQERVLEIVEKQFKLGSATQNDVLAQRTLLSETRSSLPLFQKLLSRSRHALAALVGEFPQTNISPEFLLKDLHLPKGLPVSLPSQLVKQRPDIRASVALLHQASAQIGIAVANLFPTLTLTGNAGTQSTSTKDIFANSATVWGITSTLLQPIFNAGSLRAKERAAVHAYEQAFAEYRQTVLESFQNVADSLRAIEFDTDAHEIRKSAEKSARESLALSQEQFRLGAVNYLILLNAEIQYEQARLNLIQVTGLLYEDTVALFQGLGGGWWNRGKS